jgi:Glycosyltransferase family 87
MTSGPEPDGGGDDAAPKVCGRSALPAASGPVFAGRRRLNEALWRPWLRRSSTRAGLALLIIGVAAGCAVLGEKGITASSVAVLWTVSLLALAGLATSLLPTETSHRRGYALLVAAASVACLAVMNVLWPWIDWTSWLWRAPSFFVPGSRIGGDFRFSYAAAKAFSEAPTGWPPFTVLLALPFTLLPENAAVALQMALLVVMNLATAIAAGMLVESALVDSRVLEPPDARLTAAAAAAVGTVWVLLSYGFLFGVERANYDSYAALFMVVGVVSLRRSSNPWLPTLLISLAANIKVYPALLLLLVVRRYRWRSVLPIVAINTVLALCAGPRNLSRFVHGTLIGQAGSSSAAPWFGNHSAWSFSYWVDSLHPWYLPRVPEKLLLAIPIGLLLICLVKLWSRRDETSTLVLFCCMTPVMCLVPSTSNDYKTVILVPTLIVLTGLLAPRLRYGLTWVWPAFLLLLAAGLFIARAPGIVTNYTTPDVSFVWPQLLVDKYPAILLLEGVSLWAAWLVPFSVGSRGRDASVPPAEEPARR